MYFWVPGAGQLESTRFSWRKVGGASVALFPLFPLHMSRCPSPVILRRNGGQDENRMLTMLRLKSEARSSSGGLCDQAWERKEGEIRRSRLVMADLNGQQTDSRWGLSCSQTFGAYFPRNDAVTCCISATSPTHPQALGISSTWLPAIRPVGHAARTPPPLMTRKRNVSERVKTTF